jgi:hypothetical protein
MLTPLLKIDYRLGGILKYRLLCEEESPTQVPDEVRKCVVFVCYKAADGIKFAGTAFFVGVPLENINNKVAPYLITAKHIIDKIKEHSIDQKIYLRINLKNATAQFIETSVSSWKFHPSETNVDVAILPWAPPFESFDYRIVPIEMAATQIIIEREGIGPGTDVFLTGLFARHTGTQRNLPIIRVGNIASMPEEKIYIRDLGDIDAYLIEARSIGGISGSPVFVYLEQMRIPQAEPKTTMVSRSGQVFWWLGLIHGHFELSKLEIDDLVEDSLINCQINMGIAIVIPVWKILEVINQEALMEQRKEIKKRIFEETLPVADMTNTNFTKESFEAALKKVSQKKPSPKKEEF